jgi:hypothetical protein
VNTAGAILFAKLTQQARVNCFCVLEYLVFQSYHDIAKNAPGEKVETHGTESCTETAMHACGCIEFLRTADLFEKL